MKLALVKLALVAALLRKITAAYPVAAAVLTAFAANEVYRAIRTDSIALPFFAAIDLAIIAVVLREYRALRTTHPA
ncbi:DUF2127 domain-containing protein [Actinokineospora iranica]|uniref:Predicted membrane protein n=1 Tax=Actinokineospora iranica TaxID=1271860 RepID=A0A1G6YFV3_9PSEU|nr:DUF2127 domain-containing protein [Actinokineospora iranica]SDD89161.1 Predicted membrane protein [Actinokineospora iranica]